MLKQESKTLEIGIPNKRIPKSLIKLENVTKLFGTTKRYFTALENINLEIKNNEFVFIIGRSGSGKSTLLNMISGIDRPTNGKVSILDVNLNSLSENELASWRGTNVGIIFQFFQLLPTLTILENVMLPMDFCNVIPKKDRKLRAMGLLEQVGILDQAHKLPSKLSGGEQQRAAIARSLANDPRVIIADEPTGNLDSENANSVFQLFEKLVLDGKTVIVVTHEAEIAKMGTKTVFLSDGKIVNKSLSSNNLLTNSD